MAYMNFLSELESRGKQKKKSSFGFSRSTQMSPGLTPAARDMCQNVA